MAPRVEGHQVGTLGWVRSASQRTWHYQRPGKTILGQLAYFALDRETPITATTASSLRWDLAVVRAAVEALVAQPARLVYAPVTHPGHHVGASWFGGFCFLNGAFLAARLLQRQHGYARVAIVDIDYHAPNGTIALAWDDPTVMVASLHADPAFDYPFNVGFVDDTGAHNNIVNVPLPRGTAVDAYVEHLRRVVARVAAFAPDAVVVSLGLDTLDGDPVAYPTARFALQPHDFVTIGDVLLRTGPLAALPRLVYQEGGYLLSRVPAAVQCFLGTTN